jgi:hypothetical protein
MQFTPQQLTGGPKYGHKCRIGNWSEDLELEEIKLKDFLKKKETGSLLVNSKQHQLEESLQVGELSEDPEGQMRFGHKFMLVNHQSEGFLCANPYDKVPKAKDAYALTTGPNSNPCVRNMFVVVRADENDGFGDDAVHYGQNFRLKMMPFGKITEPIYVFSELVTALAASKFSRHQEVVVYPEPNGQTLWQALHPDTKIRFEMEGQEVKAGDPVVLRHVHTGSFLGSDKIPYQNIFGAENEVHCHTYFSTNKTQNLASEKKGDITGDYTLRRHGLANVWTFISKREINNAQQVAGA